jgi:hypothetical protein
MNVNYGYQLSQAQRDMTRREIITRDAQRGQQVAAAARAYHRLARRIRASGVALVRAGTTVTLSRR